VDEFTKRQLSNLRQFLREQAHRIANEEASKPEYSDTDVHGLWMKSAAMLNCAGLISQVLD
jgi:hypothetical protein